MEESRLHHPALLAVESLLLQPSLRDRGWFGRRTGGCAPVARAGRAAPLGRGQPTRTQNQKGLSFIELIVAVSVLMVLAAAVIPLARWDEKRRREGELRANLEIMREAIDQYKKYSDQGLIVQTDVDQWGYPKSLDEMVDGVDVGDPQSPERHKVKFLARVPVDPITGEAEWGIRSYQDDWDSESWGRQNVYDVYSLAPGRALDGTNYHDW
jgi:general secretion pathway protein G